MAEQNNKSDTGVVYTTVSTGSVSPTNTPLWTDELEINTFNSVEWADGGEPAIDAHNLNRYENSLTYLLGAYVNEDKAPLIRKILDKMNDEIKNRKSDIEAVDGRITDSENQTARNIVRLDNEDKELHKRIDTFKHTQVTVNNHDGDKQGRTTIFTSFEVDPQNASDVDDQNSSYVKLATSAIDLREIDIPVLSSDVIYIGAKETVKDPQVSNYGGDTNKYEPKGSLTYKLKNTDNRIDSFDLPQINCNKEEDESRHTVIKSIKIDTLANEPHQTRITKYVEVETGEISLSEVDIPALNSNKIYLGDYSESVEPVKNGKTSITHKFKTVDETIESEIKRVETRIKGLGDNKSGNTQVGGRTQVITHISVDEGQNLAVNTANIDLVSDDIPVIDTDKIIIASTSDHTDQHGKSLTDRLDKLATQIEDTQEGILYWKTF